MLQSLRAFSEFCFLFFWVRSSSYYEFSFYLFGKIWQCTHYARTNMFCLQCLRAVHALRSDQFFVFPSLDWLVGWSCDPDNEARVSVNLRLWVQRFRDLFRRLPSKQLWKVLWFYNVHCAWVGAQAYFYPGDFSTTCLSLYLSVCQPIFQDLKLKP